MSTTAVLAAPTVRLEPGAEAVVPVEIRNDGEIVEGYRLEVVGAPGAWAVVEPAELQLYPGTTGTATVLFHPPRSAAVPAGSLPFGVRVVPLEHPDEATVPEGVCEVLPFLETTAELLPRTSRGRTGARHRVAVDNRGNTPVTVVLSGSDPANLLDIRLRQQGVTVPAGNAAFVDARVRARKTLWRGTPRTCPFIITVQPQDAASVPLDGTHLQEPIVPPWFVRALLALLALIGLLLLLWFQVFKPSVESAAEAAVADEVAEAREQAQAAATEAEAAGAAQEAAGGSADAALGSATKAEDVVSGLVLPVIERPFSQRFEVETIEGGTDVADPFTVPEEATLKITDLVISNPQGDFGRVQLELDDEVLFDLALENFRDLDYHFVSPITADTAQVLELTVECNDAGVPVGQDPAPTTCATALFLGGTLVTQPPPPAP